MNADLTRFVAEFANTSFNNSDYLFRGLAEGSILFDHASEDSKLFPPYYQLAINEERLRYVKDKYALPHTEYMRSFCSDVNDLCCSLRSQPEEVCDLWVFKEAPFFKYIVFIGCGSRRVFGCVRFAQSDTTLSEEMRRQMSRLLGPKADG